MLPRESALGGSTQRYLSTLFSVTWKTILGFHLTSQAYRITMAAMLVYSLLIIICQHIKRCRDFLLHVNVKSTNLINLSEKTKRNLWRRLLYNSSIVRVLVTARMFWRLTLNWESFSFFAPEDQFYSSSWSVIMNRRGYFYSPAQSQGFSG